MKQLSLIFAGLLMASIAFGQTLQFQAGTSLSTLSWKANNTDLGIYKTVSVGYAAFLGINYLEKKYYNLSSNLGFFRTGGVNRVLLTDDIGTTLDASKMRATLDYCSVNTTFELKYPIKDKWIPFLSAGPRFDYLVGHNGLINGVQQTDYSLKKYNVGLLFGTGAKYNFGKISLGLRADYYWNAGKVATWANGGSIKSNTASINLTLGYKI